MFKNTIFKNVFPKNYTQFVRFKNPDHHWSVIRKKKTNSTKALDYFDEQYEPIYKKTEWEKIRTGLLGKQKYVALINNYSDSEATCEFLQGKGAISMRHIVNFEKGNLLERNSKVQRQKKLEKIWATAEKTEEAIVEKPKLDFSLKKSLDEAEIDNSRIIDGNNASSILYEFVPVSKIKGSSDYVVERPVSNIDREEIAESPVKCEQEVDINFPQHLSVYCFEEGNQNQFPQPHRGSTLVYNYFLMDGGSILPVLALDLKPGNVVLDLCAAPGGKSLAALQTLYPIILHCNDSSTARVKRITNVMNQYLYNFNEDWLNSKIEITKNDGRYINDHDNYYDRVLVDVPCTTDRHSVKEDDNNIFSPDRLKERNKMPELQSELLFQAIKMVKPGGIVVYSTCSLNPIQNQGVVHMTLKKIWEETKIDAVIKDLSPALLPFKNIYKFAKESVTKYGHLVLPNAYQNYGPTYFCKIKRLR